jgi:hypothetical protein
MGTVLAILCPDCGYAEDDLLVGCGMAGFCYEAKVCRGCRKVVGVLVEAVFPHENGQEAAELDRCPSCGHQDLVEIDLDDEAAVGRWTTSGSRCPRSEDAFLRFRPVGIWD